MSQYRLGRDHVAGLQPATSNHMLLGPMADRWRHPNHREPVTLPAQLRRPGVPEEVRSWVQRRIGVRVHNVRRLAGASSTAVHALTLGDGRVLVLRRYVWPAFLVAEPDAPRREVDALRWAGDAGLPVPAVVAADPTGAEVGDGVPVVLMTRLPGRPEVGHPDALAAVAAAIHRTPATGLAHPYFPWCRATSTRPPDGATSPEVWERAHELWRTAEPPYEPCLVHRDLHPGNVLFGRGRVTGVVDWANACAGPAGIDIATCRWNLERWSGRDTADAFVAAYERRTGTTHHPYWDLATLLEDDHDLGCDAAEVTWVEQRLHRLATQLGEAQPWGSD